MNPVAIDLLLNATFAKDIHKKDRTVTSQMNKILKFMQESMGAGNKVTPFGIIPGVGPDGEEVVRGFRFLTGNAQSAQKAVSDVNEYLNRISTGLYENDKRFWGAAQINESAKLFETGSAHVLSADIKSFLKQLSSLGGSVLSTNDVIGGQTINYQVPTSRAWGSEASATTLMGGVASGYESGYKEFLRVRKNQRARELYAQRKAEEAARKAWWADYSSVELSDWKGYVADAERARKLEQRQAQERKAAIAYGVELRERGLEDADFSAIGSEGFDAEAEEEKERKSKLRKIARGYDRPDVVERIKKSEYDSRVDAVAKAKVDSTLETKPDIASAQDKKAYFTKSLAALTGILAVVGKIASALWKLTEQAVQTHYEAKSYGVNANALQSFRNALENSGIPVSEANKSIGAVVGGLINPFTLDSGLVKQLAPVLGTDLAGTIKQMLSKQEDPFGALQVIMDSARRQVNDPNSMWTMPKMVDQLGAFGPAFAGYMTWLDRQKDSSKLNFFDYAGYDPAKYMDETAEKGLQLKEFVGGVKHWFENAARDLMSRGVHFKGTRGVYQNLGIDPRSMSMDDLAEALEYETNPEINNYYREKYGYGKNYETGLPYYRDQMNKDLKTIEGAIEEMDAAASTSFLPNPLRDTTGTLVESTAYGMSPGTAPGGGMIYNEIDNSVDNSVAGAVPGNTSIDLHVLVGDKDGGTFPLQLGANNMITVGWS